MGSMRWPQPFSSPVRKTWMQSLKDLTDSDGSDRLQVTILKEFEVSDLRDPLLSACFYDNWHLSTPSWAPSQGPLGSATAPEGRILRVPKSIPGGSGAPCS